MQPFLEISQIFMTTFMLALVMPIFWIVLFLVFMQYRRQAATEEKLFGRTINHISKQMLFSLGLGALGGLLASAILIFLGLSLEQIGLYFIWPVALFLLLINPRYLCFSYAGSIVAAAVLLSRHLLVPLLPDLANNFILASLLRIHIPALLVLIGLLHLVEALLIYVHGDRGSSPMYIKSDSGKVIGAFSLQRFWPLPLVALMVTLVSQAEITGVSMPDWWPILQSVLQPGEGQSLQYMIIPVAAGLGYADIAFSSKPKERACFSAKWLALYSVILLVIALGSEYMTWLVIPGVLFAPLGHEVLILYGKKQEKASSPYYEKPENGVKLMMVLPESDAEKAGFKEGDLILKVNGQNVQGNRELVSMIEESYFMVLVEGLRDGEEFSIVFKKTPAVHAGGEDSFRNRLKSQYPSSALHRSVALGLIPVPAPDSPVYLEIKKPDPLGRFRRLKDWIMRKTGS